MTIDLHAAALTFAQEIQELLDAVLPLPPGAGPQSRQVDALHLPTGSDRDKVRYAVHIGGGVKPAGIALLKAQRPVASLVFTFRCTHDSSQNMSRLLARSNPKHVGLLSKVHLPVGGTRMRPCLEDVLQLCLLELDIDRRPGAMEAIEAGRERWRRSQAAALVRDAPVEAVRVLTDLGYQVIQPTAGIAPANEKALRSW